MARSLSLRQRAIVFVDPTISGASIGYLCVITQVKTPRPGDSFGNRDAWCYRVFVPGLGRFLDAPGSCLIAGDCCDLLPIPIEKPVSDDHFWIIELSREKS